MENKTYSDELYHHGIRGMKWGVRRYQNKDGTLTAAGKNEIVKLRILTIKVILIKRKLQLRRHPL